MSASLKLVFAAKRFSPTLSNSSSTSAVSSSSTNASSSPTPSTVMARHPKATALPTLQRHNASLTTSTASSSSSSSSSSAVPPAPVSSSSSSTSTPPPSPSPSSSSTNPSPSYSLVLSSSFHPSPLLPSSLSSSLWSSALDCDSALFRSTYPLGYSSLSCSSLQTLSSSPPSASASSLGYSTVSASSSASVLLSGSAGDFGLPSHPVFIDVYCQVEGYFNKLMPLIPSKLVERISFEEHPTALEAIPAKPRASSAILTFYSPTDRWRERISKALMERLHEIYTRVCLVLLKPINDPDKLSYVGSRGFFIDIKQLCVANDMVYDIPYNRKVLDEVLALLAPEASTQE